MLHPWTSNVRELASALERIAAIEGPPALRLETVERVLGVRETGAESSRRGLTAEVSPPAT
jgi:DNA-binding NtrC family response regulator